MKKKQPLRIGEVSAQTGLSVHTLRYYESLGLICRPRRSPGGFRLYPETEIEKIRFIKKAQSFGLTLDEIGKIMGCSEAGLTPCCEMLTDVFAGKIKEFETKIKELQQMKRRLKRLISSWSTRSL